jgi:hypothetical protein
MYGYDRGGNPMYRICSHGHGHGHGHGPYGVPTIINFQQENDV